MDTGFMWANLQGKENLEELREMSRGSAHVSSFRGVGRVRSEPGGTR